MQTHLIFYYDEQKTIYLTPYDAWHSNKPCAFYYHDNVFEKANWKVEPTQTLDQLYAERAQKIRDEYEYVIVCYSGGNDSSNILETFYYNNIHIDEIVMVGSFSQDVYDKTVDENHNSDLYLNAFPLLKTLNLPNTKITTIDYTEIFRDIKQFSLIQKYDTDWIKYIGTHKSPHNLFWHDFRKFVGRNNTKKTAWIMGNEKAEVTFSSKYTGSSAFVSFRDGPINSYGMRYHDENFTRVNFYCDPDPAAINIQIKQAHIFNKIWNLASSEQRWKMRSPYLRVSAQNKLFYNPKNPLIYQSEKSTSSFLSVRDKFLLKTQNSDIVNYYVTTLNCHNEYAKLEGGRGYNSKPYFIT